MTFLQGRLVYSRHSETVISIPLSSTPLWFSPFPILFLLILSERKQSFGAPKRELVNEKAAKRGDAWLSHRGWKESKGPPQKSLEACVSLFAGWLMVLRLFQVIVNWPFSLQSTFTYLIAFDLHNNRRAVIIFLILQMSQMKLTVVKKWAHKPNQRQNLNLNPRDRFPPLVPFHCSHPVSCKYNDQTGNTMVHSSWDVHYVNFF